MKKRVLIPYLLLTTALVIVIGLFFRTNSLQRQVNQFSTNETILSNTLETYEALELRDSILLSGDYETAIDEYQKIAMEIGSDNKGVRLRIALAEQFQRYNIELAEGLNNKGNIDSLSTVQSATPFELERFDSLSFAHEKTKIQLQRVQKLLKEKSFGEYLTFKSKKGNQMHYVGQVKNNKANGFGIALLDTGSRYEGEWKDNERHGEGTFYWPDGEYYIGNYSQDKRNGLGTYHWPNGEKYIGFWKDDKREGQGDFYSSDGTVVTSGIWKNDKLTTKGKKGK